MGSYSKSRWNDAHIVLIGIKHFLSSIEHTVYSPWLSGAYESQVKEFKSMCHKGLGKLTLTHDQLVTAVCKISAAINSRLCWTVRQRGNDNTWIFYLPLFPYHINISSMWQSITLSNAIQFWMLAKIIISIVIWHVCDGSMDCSSIKYEDFVKKIVRDISP